jgi:hypothetical protein
MRRAEQRREQGKTRHETRSSMKRESEEAGRDGAEGSPIGSVPPPPTEQNTSEKENRQAAASRDKES